VANQVTKHSNAKPNQKSMSYLLISLNFRRSFSLS